jgi:transposase InsO family protein
VDCYKSFAFRDACGALGIKRIHTKPYTPKTNGKASASSRPRSGVAYAQA